MPHNVRPEEQDHFCEVLRITIWLLTMYASSMTEVLRLRNMDITQEDDFMQDLEKLAIKLNPGEARSLTNEQLMAWIDNPTLYMETHKL